MNLIDLIDSLTEKYPELTHKKVSASVRTILGGISNAMIQGNRVEVRDFGSFVLNYRAPRKGRNPKTGESVEIPLKYAVHFEAGKKLKESVDYGAS